MRQQTIARPQCFLSSLSKEPSKRVGWFQAFGIIEGQLRNHSLVCCRHFHDGDSMKEPVVTLGKRFASPIKGKHPRAKRAKAREAPKLITELSRHQSLDVSLRSSMTQREEGPSECGEGAIPLHCQYSQGMLQVHHRAQRSW